MEQPVQETVVEQPVQEPVVEQSVQEPVEGQPVQENAEEQPVQEAVVEQPVQETVVEQPVQGTVVEQPVQETVVEQPVQENVEEQPVQESVAERAAVENVGETAEEVTEEGAVEEAVTKEDASGKAATEEEATEEAVSKEEAAEKAATEEEAAEKAATEEKTAEAAAENDKGSNEIHTKEDTEETIEIASEDEELTIESEAGNAAPFAHLEKEQSTRGFVYRLYKIVLGREPDADGLNYWVNELNSGRRKAASAVAGFFESKEYQNKSKNNDAVVTDCYNAMLNRAPDAAGKADWEKRLNVGMTSRAVLSGFVGSREFRNLCNKYGIQPGTLNVEKSRDKNFERTYFVYRLYANCLEREPDMDGLESWCKELEKGKTGANLAHGFIFSKEYLNRHTRNDDFVNMLYHTMMGREADHDGYMDWYTKVCLYNTREHLLNGFLFSKEFQNQCARAGINVGAAIAEKDGSSEWKTNTNIVRTVNHYRRLAGLRPVVLRQDIWEVGLARAVETEKYFSLRRPDGTKVETMFREFGIKDTTAIHQFIFRGPVDRLVADTTSDISPTLEKAYLDPGVVYVTSAGVPTRNNFLVIVILLVQ